MMKQTNPVEVVEIPNEDMIDALAHALRNEMGSSDVVPMIQIVGTQKRRLGEYVEADPTDSNVPDAIPVKLLVDRNGNVRDQITVEGQTVDVEVV